MTYQNNCQHREVLTTCILLACCSCCLNFSPIIFLGWESIQNFSSHEQLCSNRIIQCEFQFSWEPIVFFKDYTHLTRQIQKIYAQNFISFLNAFINPNFMERCFNSSWWCRNVHQWGTRSLHSNNRCLKIRKCKETPSRGVVRCGAGQISSEG